MMFLQFISENGLEGLLLALATVILTGLIKMPIKKLASKSSNSKKITRFITFLPIFIGFGLTVLLDYLMSNTVVFDQTFFAQWLSAVSLSLAIYAFWEQFVPSEEKILSNAEIEANKNIVEELKSRLITITTNAEKTDISEPTVESSEQVEDENVVNHKKIILTNNKNNK